MKAFIKSLKFIGASFVFLALAACGKSDGGTQVAAVQYGYQNGSCYDVTHNTPAAYNLCTGVGTAGQYQYINNQCVLGSSNQVVDPTYCQQSQYGQFGNQYGQYGQNGQYGYNTYGSLPGSVPYGQAYATLYGSNYYPNTYGGGAYTGSESCVGSYYQSNGFSGQVMICGGGQCSGLFLYKQSTHARVLCL
jgi:hypothetical protein